MINAMIMNEAKEKAIEELTREIFRLHPDVPCWAKGNDEMFTKTMAYMARLGFDAGFTAAQPAAMESLETQIDDLKKWFDFYGIELTPTEGNTFQTKFKPRNMEKFRKMQNDTENAAEAALAEGGIRQITDFDEIKPVICRKCGREYARSDGLRIFFGPFPVPNNPKRIDLVCSHCKAEVTWRCKNAFPKSRNRTNICNK